MQVDPLLVKADGKSFVIPARSVDSVLGVKLKLHLLDPSIIIRDRALLLDGVEVHDGQALSSLRLRHTSVLSLARPVGVDDSNAAFFALPTRARAATTPHPSARTPPRRPPVAVTVTPERPAPSLQRMRTFTGVSPSHHQQHAPPNSSTSPSRVVINAFGLPAPQYDRPAEPEGRHSAPSSPRHGGGGGGGANPFDELEQQQQQQHQHHQQQQHPHQQQHQRFHNHHQEAAPQQPPLPSSPKAPTSTAATPEAAMLASLAQRLSSLRASCTDVQGAASLVTALDIKLTQQIADVEVRNADARRDRMIWSDKVSKLTRRLDDTEEDTKRMVAAAVDTRHALEKRIGVMERRLQVADATRARVVAEVAAEVVAKKSELARMSGEKGVLLDDMERSRDALIARVVNAVRTSGVVDELDAAIQSSVSACALSAIHTANTGTDANTTTTAAAADAAAASSGSDSRGMDTQAPMSHSEADLFTSMVNIDDEVSKIKL